MSNDSVDIGSMKKKAQLLIRQQQFNAAKNLYVEICNSNPRDAEAWFMLGAINGQLGRADETIACSQKAINLQPEYIGAYCNIARTQLATKKSQEAIYTCQRGISIQDNYPQLHLVLGLAYSSLNNHKDAVRCYRKAISIESNLLEAQLSLGVSLKHIGMIPEAVNSFCTATKIAPDDIRAYSQLITIYRNSDRAEEALNCYFSLLKIQPNNPILHHDIGATLVAMGRGDEAIGYYEKTIQLKPDFASAYLGLGEVYLLKKQLDDIRRVTKKMHASLPGHPYEQLLLARLERREDNLEAASKRLLKLTESELDTGSSAKVNDELGHVFDLMGRYPEAMKAFTRAQSDYSKPYINHINKQSFYQTIKTNRNWFISKNVNRWRDNQLNDDVSAPIFIIGFPRSGTTLIEQILAAHSEVIVSDERPILITLLNQIPILLNLQVPFPEVLNRISNKQITTLRNHYWKLYEKSIGTLDKNKVFIDKLPLNSIHLGFLNRIFPEAKIIIALRDPRDVCLSCYIQVFQLNAAMIQFTDLDSTAKAYSETLDLLNHYQEVLKLDIFEYRYEDIVADTESVARQVLSFLDLDWQESVLSFYQFKRKRTITTPSHEAISTPVYTKAVGRWRNYKKEIEPILPILQPYVKKNGYNEN